MVLGEELICDSKCCSLYYIYSLILLVGGATGGGFETLRGDKTHCFITQNPKLNNYTKLTIHTLSFSLMFLTILSTQININEHPIYT